ncbi:MAG: hypothetical protein GY737_06635 [Desulfobacteraceae bacterium]|nr:hypothetical protein [Desulfobacteraceae bacterium]
MNRIQAKHFKNLFHLILLCGLILMLQACNSGSSSSKKAVPAIPAKIPIEKSIITLGNKTWKVEKLGAGERVVPDIGTEEALGGLILTIEGNNGADYGLLSSENGITPDGSVAIFRIGKETYLGSQLNLSEKESSITLTGNLKKIEKGIPTGNSLPCTVTVTESQVGGGTSEFYIDGNEALLNGELGTRTYNQVIDILTNHPEVDTIVEVDVPGSVNDEVNMKTGRMIRDHGFTTKVPTNGHIASGGVDLFCAGIIRTIGKGARVGVHSWAEDDGKAAADYPEDDPAHDAQISYFNTMLGTPQGRDFYFYTITAAKADNNPDYEPTDMHYMTVEEIAKWKLETE